MVNISSDYETLQELRLIRGLLTASLLRSFPTGTPQQEQIAALSNAGLQPKEIAELLGVLPNNVSVALVALRKAGKVKAAPAKTKKVAANAK